MPFLDFLETLELHELAVVDSKQPNGIDVADLPISIHLVANESHHHDMQHDPTSQVPCPSKIHPVGVMGWWRKSLPHGCARKAESARSSLQKWNP